VTVDSLEKLSAAFEEWRTRKKHVRERMPEELLRRAHRAARAYGYGRVARATKVDRRRLDDARAPVAAHGGGRGPGATPAYSRVELVGPATSARPFAELETPSGVKLRLYTPTPEALDLLASVCASGGGR
jgi:hypothetical protein